MKGSFPFVLISFTYQRKLTIYRESLFHSGEVYCPIELIPVWHKDLLDWHNISSWATSFFLMAVVTLLYLKFSVQWAILFRCPVIGTEIRTFWCFTFCTIHRYSPSPFIPQFSWTGSLGPSIFRWVLKETPFVDDCISVWISHKSCLISCIRSTNTMGPGVHWQATQAAGVECLQLRLQPFCCGGMWLACL